MVNYQINKENFTKALNDESYELFRNTKREQQINLLHYKVIRIFSNTDLFISALIHNSTSGEWLFMRLVKKWKSYNSSIGHIRSYASVFEEYSNPEDDSIVQVEMILDHPAFLVVITPYYPLGSVFNYIYSVQIDRKTFAEPVVFKMAYKLLKTIQTIHSKNSLLMCIKPENIFFSSQNSIKLMHLSSFKLDFKSFADNIITENIEYLPPELFKGDVEISFGIDYWYLGITM